LNVQPKTSNQVEKEETKTATINIKVLKQRPAKLTAAEKPNDLLDIGQLWFYSFFYICSILSLYAFELHLIFHFFCFVQRIVCKEIQTYTINAYLTKCSLLINGKNVEKFIDDDIKEIHSILHPALHRYPHL
jgi:hypothetical protein